ncbi:peptidase [Pantoea agglomerans]|uniref:Rz1-like lysis system protein LysC n=1 Tax=Enterobacter agglomerans TaxID=549 RepID=UPI003AF30015
MLSKITCALASSFLILLLSGCASKQTEYEVVNRPVLPVPANLLADCPIPLIPANMTFGDSVQLNIKLLNSLDICNGQLSAIRKIEESRASLQ